MKRSLALDLGASSGRAILGKYDRGTLTVKEIHRFPNVPREKDGYLRWDFQHLLQEVRKSIELAGPLDSLAFDTWGVDFGLLDRAGRLLEDPIHYRDPRTNGAVEEATKKMSVADIYKETGNQIMPINTLFQLMKTDTSHAEKLLFMPDLFAYALCGTMVCERTIASTSQMLNPRSEVWSTKLLNTFGIPESLFAPLIHSGTIIGSYRGADVISVAGHDTQCAVAAIPGLRADEAFLSCGTWSLLGCELDAPIMSEESLQQGFSNELGANGKINYLKNIIGLWLLQESRRQWQSERQAFSFEALEALAVKATPLRSLIDPDDDAFLPPGDMPARIQDFCRRTGQPIPVSIGDVTRCIYESLALKYRSALEGLSAMTGKRFSCLRIIGGGAQAKLLCQLTADCIGIPVIAGPVEATALGNLKLQLGALRQSADQEIPVVSADTATCFYPSAEAHWAEAYERYQTICEKGRQQV